MIVVLGSAAVLAGLALGLHSAQAGQAAALEYLAAPEERASLVRSNTPGISGLTLHEDIVIRPVRKNDVSMGLAEIRGNFRYQARGLLYKKTFKVVPDAKGDFLLRIPVRATESSLFFSAVKASGEVENEEMKIRLPRWTIWSQTIASASVIRPEQKKRWMLSPGLGVTYQTYEQAGFATLRQFALTPKMSFSYQLAPGRWELGGNAFITALPAGSNYPDLTFRTLGANIRVGFTLPSGALTIRDPWKLTLMAGTYYTTILASPATLGYRNTAGPQLFPVLSRALAEGGSWSAYLKYSPVSNGLSILSLSNAELASGFAYQRFKIGSAPVSLTLDFARLSLRISTGNIYSTSLTAGAAIGF